MIEQMFDDRKHADASIQNEYRHVRLNSVPNLYHLLEQFRFLFMPAAGIHDDDFKALLFEFNHSLCCDTNGVSLGVRSEVGHFGLRCGLSSLVKGTRAKRVSTDYARLETTLLVVNS